jgi:hypothetical protein
MAETRSLSESEAAPLLLGKGHKVVTHRSRRWAQVRPGFYQPVHVLGAVESTDVSRPTRACWGYRVVVPPGTKTDSRLLVYLVDDVPGYDMGALTRSRRNTLRQVQRSALRLRPFDDDALLQREGYEVCLSAYTRFGFRSLPPAQRYSQWLSAQRIGEQTQGIGATLDGKLVGYILAHVIEGTSYIEELHVATEALPTNVSTALTYEMLQLLRESGVVKRTWNGNVGHDDRGMYSFKSSMGFACTAFPTRVRLWPGTGALLRRYRPQRYERLMGQFEM